MNDCEMQHNAEVGLFTRPSTFYIQGLYVNVEEKMGEHFDTGSIIIILITFVLFVIALFTKGFTHNLLLEAGVFLVSVKLILMAYKNSVIGKEITRDLQEIKKIIEGTRESRT